MQLINDDQDRSGTTLFPCSKSDRSGFQSVLFSSCRTADDAWRCVCAVRPDTPQAGGTHGMACRRIAFMRHGATPQYAQALNDVVVVLMIEKKEAAENLEDILSVQGIDMIQWGPGDYSMSIGRLGDINHPEVSEAENYVLETAARKAISVRAEVNSLDNAKFYLDRGVRHFCLGWEIFILLDWLREKGSAVRNVIESN